MTRDAMCLQAAPQSRTVMLVDMAAYKETVKGMARHVAELQASAPTAVTAKPVGKPVAVGAAARKGR